MLVRGCKQRRVSFVLVWGDRSPAGGTFLLFLCVFLCVIDGNGALQVMFFVVL